MGRYDIRQYHLSKEFFPLFFVYVDFDFKYFAHDKNDIIYPLLHVGSGSAERVPDPDPDSADPYHWFKRLFIKWNTGCGQIDVILDM